MKIMLGMILTAIAIIFNKLEVIEGTTHQYTQYPAQGHHRLERLPDWKIFGHYIMRPYNNMRDGLKGDKRGWYAAKKGDGKWHKWWWNAVRNPMNTQKRLYNAIDISRCKTWVAKGYKEHVDDDLETDWGEKLVYAQDLDTNIVYESYEKITPFAPFGIKTGYVVRRMSGYKFDLGEERIPFPDPVTPMTFEFYRDQCEQYARDGYHKGEAMINLDRLAPENGRKEWMFTLKKINNK